MFPCPPFLSSTFPLGRLSALVRCVRNSSFAYNPRGHVIRISMQNRQYTGLLFSCTMFAALIGLAVALSNVVRTRHPAALSVHLCFVATYVSNTGPDLRRYLRIAMSFRQRERQHPTQNLVLRLSS